MMLMRDFAVRGSLEDRYLYHAMLISAESERVENMQATRFDETTIIRTLRRMSKRSYVNMKYIDS